MPRTDMDRAGAPTSPPLAPPTSFWRRWAIPTGLQGRLVLCFSLLLLVALTASFWSFASRTADTVSDILGEQARQIAQTLAMASGPACEVQDVTQLQQLGRELLKGRNIVLVVYYDAAGEPLAVASRDPDMSLDVWLAGPEPRASTPQLMLVRRRHLPSLGEYLQVTAPVLAQRQSPGWEGLIQDEPAALSLLGYLTVGISQHNEQKQLQRVSAISILVGCIIFLLSLPLAGGMVHRVFLPIRQLVAAANRIASGEYDAHVATDRPDEIGQLARSFNEMVRRIHQHQQQLKIANERLAEANRDLEAKVRQRTAELEAANHRLSAEIAEKEDFLRAVSHDLNAPLRNISGMASMLLLKCRDRFDDDIIHRLERIRRNVEVETDLIAELLELSRIKTRRQRMETVAMDALVHDVAALFESDLRQRNIALEIHGPLPNLHCERARLRQVFQNLIDNAIKYMGDGPVRRIEIGHRMRDEEVEFYVADTGVGIHSEDLTRIFYVFRRGRNSTVAGVPGRGVGLASVKSIVETYNGRIWVESQPGQGSVFRFTIHRRFVPAMQAAMGEATVAPAAPL